MVSFNNNNFVEHYIMFNKIINDMGHLRGGMRFVFETGDLKEVCY